MKTTLVRLILFVLVSLFVVSCQKEGSFEVANNNNNGNALVGTWKFTSLRAITKVDISASDGTDSERIVSTSDYTTTNNKGTIKFNASDFKGEGIAYDVETDVKAVFYINGVIEDSLEIPFAFSLPPTSSVGNYKIVGADSVYFSGGFVAVGLDSMESKPIGYKFTISGNKLTMKSKYANAFTENDMGVLINTKQFADITILMEK
jgi:hypothetical protein